MITVLLIDDHALVRSAVKLLLTSGAPDIEIIGEASSGKEAIPLVRQYHPNVVLLDINMPGMSGLEVTFRIQRTSPKTKIIILTAQQNSPFPGILVQAGVHGYLTKIANTDAVIEAIRTVHRGETFLPPEIAQQLALEKLQPQEQQSPLAQLSSHEFEILWMISHGMSADDIAKELSRSKKTVHSYRHSLFKKFSVNNDVELAKVALRYGLMEL